MLKPVVQDGDIHMPFFFFDAPGDRRFHCFGCGVHGDVIDLLQKIGGMSFIDAVEALAAGASAAEIIGRIPADARGNMLACTRTENVTSPICLVRSDPRVAGAAAVFELKEQP